MTSVFSECIGQTCGYKNLGVKKTHTWKDFCRFRSLYPWQTDLQNVPDGLRVLLTTFRKRPAPPLWARNLEECSRLHFTALMWTKLTALEMSRAWWEWRDPTSLSGRSLLQMQDLPFLFCAFVVHTLNYLVPLFQAPQVAISRPSSAFLWFRLAMLMFEPPYFKRSISILQVKASWLSPNMGTTKANTC